MGPFRLDNGVPAANTLGNRYRLPALENEISTSTGERAGVSLRPADVSRLALLADGLAVPARRLADYDLARARAPGLRLGAARPDCPGAGD
jgi:hypothetical protein